MDSTVIGATHQYGNDDFLQAQGNWLWLFGQCGPASTSPCSKTSFRGSTPAVVSIPFYLGPRQKPFVSKQHVVITPMVKGIQSMVDGYRMASAAHAALVPGASDRLRKIANLMLVRGRLVT